MNTRGLFISFDDGEADVLETREDNATRQATESIVESVMERGNVDAARSDAATCSPSLSMSNISNEDKREPWQFMGSHHRCAQLMIELEAEAMCKRFGVERVGFQTWTVKENLVDMVEAQRRWNILATAFLRGRYRHMICVVQFQKRGAIHFHLLVAVPVDIRTGFDHEAVMAKDYRSASKWLKDEWRAMREAAESYGFGRSELKPIRKNGQAAGCYLAGYLKKHISERRETDKGCKMVRFLGYKDGERVCKGRFQILSDKAWVWRHKVKWYCIGKGIKSTNELLERVGKRWAFLLREEIVAVRIEETFSSEAAMELSHAWSAPAIQAQHTARKILEARGCIEVLPKPFAFPGDLEKVVAPYAPPTMPANEPKGFPWVGVRATQARGAGFSTNVKATYDRARR